MRVLVVDDDPVYRSLLDDMLRKWGYEVLLAADGREAWDMLQRHDDIRLMLVDWMMPNVDGFEFCRRVRQAPSMANHYILILTGSRQKEEIIKVVVAGADDYLIKPFEAIDLRVHLRTADRVLNLQAELQRLCPGETTASA